MAFIESILLYFGLAILGGGVLLLIVVVSLVVLKLLFLLFKKDVSLLKLVVLKKSLKFYIIGYFVFASLFYIVEAKIYLFGDRAYKEAKVYAIAGEYVFWHKVFLLSFVYPDNAVLKPLDAVESYILKKMYKYIPPTDAERQIWNYKFHLVDYAKTMFAPMINADRSRGLSFTNPAASMKPELLDILYEIYMAMDMLSKDPIKDKKFNQIDRYLVIASMAPYYKEYMLYQANLISNIKDRNYYGHKWTTFYFNSQLKDQFLNYLHILDKTYQIMQEDRKLRIAFEKHPSLKASLYWGGVNGYIALSNLETSAENIYPCSNPNFLKFVNYYKEYTHWAYMNPHSSFHSLSKRQKKNYDFKIESQNNAYYTAKYICKIPFEYMTKQEKSINSFKNFESLYIDRPNIKHIRQLEKQLNKGKENG